MKNKMKKIVILAIVMTIVIIIMIMIMLYTNYFLKYNINDIDSGVINYLLEKGEIIEDNQNNFINIVGKSEKNNYNIVVFSYINKWEKFKYGFILFEKKYNRFRRLQSKRTGGSFDITSCMADEENIFVVVMGNNTQDAKYFEFNDCGKIYKEYIKDGMFAYIYESDEQKVYDIVSGVKFFDVNGNEIN